MKSLSMNKVGKWCAAVIVAIASMFCFRGTGYGQ